MLDSVHQGPAWVVGIVLGLLVSLAVFNPRYRSWVTLLVGWFLLGFIGALVARAFGWV